MHGRTYMVLNLCATDFIWGLPVAATIVTLCSCSTFDGAPRAQGRYLINWIPRVRLHHVFEWLN